MLLGLDVGPGARAVRPARRRRAGRDRRPGPRVLRRPERARPREALRASRPASSGSGWRCTRSPTGRSSPACRGCASTSSAWCARRSTRSTPTRSSSSTSSPACVEEAPQGQGRAGRRRARHPVRQPPAADHARQDRRAHEPARGPRRRHDGPRRRRPHPERRPLRPRAPRAPGQRQRRWPSCCSGSSASRPRSTSTRRASGSSRRSSGSAAVPPRSSPVWRGASWLPTLAEIREPEEWLSRVRLCRRARRVAGAAGRPAARGAAFPPAGPPVTCAVSGGPDSLALLVLAVEAGCESPPSTSTTGCGPGSAAEADVVAAAAARFGAAFRAERVDVAAGPEPRGARPRRPPRRAARPAPCSATPPTTRPRRCS